MVDSTRSKVELQCGDCGATLQLHSAERTTTCLYCGSPTVVRRPPSAERPNPTFVVPLVIDSSTARNLVSRFQSRLGWFKPPRLRSMSLAGLRAVYVPAYLYSAIVESHYGVSIGETYTVNSGKHRRTVTEWRPLQGRTSSYVRDIVVTASRGLHNQELMTVEPYDLRVLHRYTEALISGWPAEEPSMSRDECCVWARQEAHQQMGVTLTRFMPGDCHKDLQHAVRLSQESVELILVPLWLLDLAYHPGRRPVRVLINGQTGRFHAHVPTDPWRVGLAVGMCVALGLILIAGPQVAALLIERFAR